MNYYDGKKVRLGDKVLIGKDDAVVVCIINEGSAYLGYKFEDWSHLNKGVLFNGPRLGDILFEFPDEDTVLVSRGERVDLDTDG